MTSLPGVLTAVAGLVTAVTGGGLYLTSSSNQSEGGGGGGTVVVTMAPAPVPEGNAQVDVQDLDSGLEEESGDDEITALMEGCAAGYVDDCTTLLYALADGCSVGDWLMCDVLYEISVPGSAFEDYGATCGGRVEDWTYADICSSGS